MRSPLHANVHVPNPHQRAHCLLLFRLLRSSAEALRDPERFALLDDTVLRDIERSTSQVGGAAVLGSRPMAARDAAAGLCMPAAAGACAGGMSASSERFTHAPSVSLCLAERGHGTRTGAAAPAAGPRHLQARGQRGHPAREARKWGEKREMYAHVRPALLGWLAGLLLL